MIDQILVDVEIGGQTVQAGVAHFSRHNGHTSTSFRYDQQYLNSEHSYALDPSLPLFSGPRSTPGLPGSFQDCSPDRWGRNLISKRLRAEARSEGRTPSDVADIDFLAHVSDASRQGALRFRNPDGSVHISPDSGVPKLIALPHLLNASSIVARDDEGNLAAVKVLLDAGSGSLGGARPKASVVDGEKLLLAKFPHPNDGWDVMSWEKTALDLAESSGILSPRRSLEKVGSARVLLLDRFDRSPTGSRIGYISAMTMTESADGDPRDYADIVESMIENSAYPSEDLRSLWQRAALSVAIHNTDDHLRNHGFLRDESGWRLSPVFDINANPQSGSNRATSIAGATEFADEADGLMALADDCRLAQDEARLILQEVLHATAQWKNVARSNGVKEREIEMFSDAFELQRETLGRAAQRTVFAGESSSGSAPSKTTGGSQGRRGKGKAGGQYTQKRYLAPDVNL